MKRKKHTYITKMFNMIRGKKLKFDIRSNIRIIFTGSDIEYSK